MEINASFFREVENGPRFEYAGGGVTPMRQEPGEWRTLPISLISQIKHGDICIYRDDKEPYFVQAGEVCFMPPGARHKIDNLWEGTNVSRWSHFNIFILSSVDIMTLVDTPPILTGDTAQLIGDINEELSFLFKMEKPEFRHLLRRQALGYQLVEIIVSTSRANTQGQRLLPHLERLSPVLNYIHDNIMRTMTREELAHLVFLSPSRFYGLFKEAMGVSPTDYIQNARMQQAQRLLLNSGISVHDIATTCGYPNTFHFSRLFKKRFGSSPLQYRKSIGKTIQP